MQGINLFQLLLLVKFKIATINLNPFFTQLEGFVHQVKQAPVVTYYQNSGLALRYQLVQFSAGLDIQVVGRFVE
ncbi:hypothetical protein D3C73_1560430 [compost metagenome]